MAVKEHSHPSLAAVGLHGRHADTVGRVKHAVAGNGKTGRAAESWLNQPPLTAIGHDFRHTAIDEMRYKEAVIGGQDEVIDARPDFCHYGLVAALQIETENLTALTLGRKYSAFAVELDGGRYGEVAHKTLRAAPFYRHP